MDIYAYHGGATNWWPPTGDHLFLYKFNRLRFEYFDRFIKHWENVRVLDVGCGGGYASEFLARRGAVVSGTDVMAEALQEAQTHAEQENLAIEYHPCTAEQLPFDDQTMDAVVCVDVLEHIPDKAQTLREIHRVLKPGGWFFFDTFNRTIWSKLFIIWLGEIVIRFMKRGTHYWPLFIRCAELTHLLDSTGFTQLEIGGVKGAWSARKTRKVPLKVSSTGSTAIIYFGACRKMTGPGS